MGVAVLGLGQLFAVGSGGDLRFVRPVGGSPLPNGGKGGEGRGPPPPAAKEAAVAAATSASSMGVSLFASGITLGVPKRCDLMNGVPSSSSSLVDPPQGFGFQARTGPPSLPLVARSSNPAVRLNFDHHLEGGMPRTTWQTLDSMACIG